MIDCSKHLPGILRNYPVSIVRHEHLRTSENVVLKLWSDSDQLYALRIRKVDDSYLKRITSELVYLRDLHEQLGLDVPLPMPTRSGELYCVMDIAGETYMCILFNWVAGKHMDAQQVSSAEMKAMVIAVSRLHGFSSKYNTPVDFVRPVYDEEWYFGTQAWNSCAEFVDRLAPADAERLLLANDAVRTFMRELPRDAASFGLIHYDLHVGNFLFHEGTANMIDFDECGFGYCLFDLAHLLFEYVERPDYTAFRRIVIKEYSAARSIDRIADRDLNMFLALQGIAYANWLYRIFRRDGNVEAMEYWVPIIVRRLDVILG